jgi:hypothetical protein
MLSLGNGLWIRPVPIEIFRLTLPKALLIARVYPCVFLWPKDAKLNRSSSGRPRGQRDFVRSESVVG